MSVEDKILEDNEAGNNFLKSRLHKDFIEHDLDLDFLKYVSWGALVLLPDFFRVLQMNFAGNLSEQRGWLRTYSAELGAVPETMLLSDSGIRVLLDYLWQRLERL